MPDKALIIVAESSNSLPRVTSAQQRKETSIGNVRTPNQMTSTPTLYLMTWNCLRTNPQDYTGLPESYIGTQLSLSLSLSFRGSTSRFNLHLGALRRSNRVFERHDSLSGVRLKVLEGVQVRGQRLR